MKRVYKRRQEPEPLRKYRLSHPEETWEHFRRRSGRGYNIIKKEILEDQHGLCAYCEIAIKEAQSADEVDDFRVEHFYPKNATEQGGHNYHLDWQNLLGVCHGGSQRDVPDAQWRFSTMKGDRTCDVPKGGKPISNLILNPLKIPGRRRIFRYLEHNGKMLVDEKTCPKELQAKAWNTIKELNLNAPRLKRMRKQVIMALEDAISEGLAAGQPLEEVLLVLAETMLPNYEGRMLPFFSVIRWYLGEPAEYIIKNSGSKL